MNIRTLTAAILGAALAAGIVSAGAAADPAPQKEKSERQCFWTRNVDGFHAINDTTVNVTVGVRDVYQLVLFTPSPDIDWSHQIAIVSRGGPSICTGLDATVIVPTALGQQRYDVKSVRKLTAEEVAASKRKPKA